MVRQEIAPGMAGPIELGSARPFWIGGAQCGGRARIWIKTQIYQRGCAPSCPGVQAGGRPTKSTEPGTRGARQCSALIARTRDNRNRHGTGDCTPAPPAMKLRQIVATHQPHELRLRVTSPQRAQRIERVARSQFGLNRGGHDTAAPRLFSRRGQPRSERSHPSLGLERIARRDQPPHRVKVQRAHCEQADRAVPAMRRVETPAQESDSGQGRICPVPRTSHL